MTRKILILCLIIANSFAMSESEIMSQIKTFGMSLWTEAPLRYFVVMNYWNEMEGFKLPPLKFYKNKDLSGKPDFHITKDGLYKNKELVCETYKQSGKYNRRKILNSYCKLNPFTTDYRDVANEELLLIHDIDKKKKVAKVKIAETYYYIDFNLLKNYKLFPPTRIMLSQVLSKKDIEQIDSLLRPLREPILKKDFEGFKLKMFSRKQYETWIGGDRANFREFFKDKKTIKDYYYHRILEALYIDLLQYASIDDIKHQLRESNSMCLDSIGNDIRICFARKDGKWDIYRFILLNLRR